MTSGSAPDIERGRGGGGRAGSGQGRAGRNDHNRPARAAGRAATRDETPEDLAAAVERLAAGSGPVAVDAERASGYRYGQKAYLVQLWREGAGTVLIDPVACPDLSGLDAALAGTEAVLHAASQDLPCLAEIGYRPRGLFDTELAGRLLGYPRVALGTMLEEVLGYRLAKEHSAADWSIRPLPEEMLRYAALDVEVLVELRDALAVQLAEQGKTEWARQEFAAIVSAAAAAAAARPVAPHVRHSQGAQQAGARRRPRAVGGRDEIAREADLSPRRVLADQAIVERRAEAQLPRRPAAARPDQRVPRHGTPAALRPWLAAVLRARELRRQRAARGGRRRRGHRSAARAPLVRARPGRGGAADGGPGGDRRAGVRAPAAGREPARAGRGAPAEPGNRPTRRPRRRSPRRWLASAPGPGRRS